MFLGAQCCNPFALILVAVDDVDKGRLQAGTADEEAVNVGLLAEVL